MRVLLDTNLFISYLLPSPSHSHVVAIVEQGLAQQYTLLVPEPLLEEITRVVARKPYLAAHISPAAAGTLLVLLRAAGEVMAAELASPLPLTRDPKDDYLLMYAVAGQADYLVTGDADLLVLDPVGALRIVSPADFAALLAPDEETD